MKQKILLIISALFSFSIGFSQPTSWASKGIGSGGALQNPAISPQFSNNVYVTCDMSQVFNSSNGGQAWQIIDHMQLQGGLYGKVCFTNNSNKLYAIGQSSNGSYVCKHSTDAGATWSPLISSPTITSPLKIYSDLTNSLNLVVANSNTIYFSNNGGATMSTIAIETASVGIHLAGVFFDSPNIYICSNKSLFVSMNNGSSFSTLTTHSTAAITASQEVVSFTGAKQGGTVKFYCTTISASNLTCKTYGSDVNYYKGLYIMTQPLPTWTSIDANLQSCTSDIEKAYYIVTNPTDYNTIYIGGSIGTPSGTFGTVYKSIDAGVTWTNKFMNASVALTNSNIATGWIGNSSSASYTHLWLSINTIEGICIDPNNINHIIRTDKSAIYKSLDGGNTWTQTFVDPADANAAGTNVPPNKYYKGIGIETFASYWLTWVTSQTLIASCADISAIVSNDFGNKWSYDYNSTNIRNAALKINDVSSIVKHPKTGILYASTGDIVGSNGTWDDSRLSQSRGRLCFSTDNGANWTVMKNFNHPVTFIEIDRFKPDTMYVCVHDTMTGTEGRIYRCSNVSMGASATWTTLSQPSRANHRPNNVYVLSGDTLMASYYPLDSLNSGSTAFAFKSGVFYSVDGGANWIDRTDLNDPNMKRGVMNIIPDRNDPTMKTWFAFVKATSTSTNGGLYRTTNRGTSWTNVMPVSSFISGTFHPTLPNEMYICSEKNGLYYANATNSNSFVPVAQNSYPFRNPQRVFFNPYNVNEVWVTSFGYGLCVGTTSLTTSEIENFVTSDLLQLYPVPTKDLLNIQYKGELKLIEVFDAAGKKVNSFTEQNQINVSNLPEGLYFISTTDKFNHKLNGKFIVSKN